MDALTHCIETFLSPLVNPPAEAIALDGVARATRWLVPATEDGQNREARWNMMMASMEGALTFQKGLGAVHAMAHPLGALPDLPLHHGTLNAVLLPTVLRYNEAAVQEKLPRLREVIGLSSDADVAGYVTELTGKLGLPSGLGGAGRHAGDASHGGCPRCGGSGERDEPTYCRPGRLRGHAGRIDGPLVDHGLSASPSKYGAAASRKQMPFERRKQSSGWSRESLEPSARSADSAISSSDIRFPSIALILFRQM